MQKWRRGASRTTPNPSCCNLRRGQRSRSRVKGQGRCSRGRARSEYREACRTRRRRSSSCRCGRRRDAPRPTYRNWTHTYTHTHTHPLNGPLFGTTRVSRYQKGKTNLDFTGARDSGWQWHQLGPMQVYTSLQTDNHASTPPLSFLQAACHSCCQANSVKALKAKLNATHTKPQRDAY